ncbi:hypothetical protein EKO23_20185 [Nocardioides guangzhouensis]|uniref:Aminoglycoside phosphotransferase domain-containing protein n=1 Tax=Nocardioides guangzhouensis TaxID=2497878 RepID=A0A4V1XYF3_9ACTN|nr:hypothetical protein [Nocardioides guangzhouensis]RYP83049.1 hypothetical protein EKO23_20185 [Nocardioides guangzhouensis]
MSDPTTADRHDRSALGAADVTNERLAEIAASSLGLPPDGVRLLDSVAEEFPYDLPAITTGGRWWVSGHLAVNGSANGGAPAPFRVFVKVVQNWSRSPLFQFVPPEHREMAAAGVPWRTEPLVYRSDLRDRLPEGLAMPRALAVDDLDESSSAIWLEEVPVVEVTWDHDRYARAARLLGRLAASPEVAVHRNVGESSFHLRVYLDGRLAMQVMPMLRDEGIWQHPLVAHAFDDELRDRVRAAADLAPAYVAELSALPYATAHGDACPNNLLAGADDGFVLIDYGFWGPNPIGFDLGQLLVGDVQVGRRSSADLAELEDLCLAEYVEGLRAEGCDVPLDVVRRAHALHLLIFTGLSTLPFEHLDQPPTPELHALARERAAIARFSLDLVDATD